MTLDLDLLRTSVRSCVSSRTRYMTVGTDVLVDVLALLDEQSTTNDETYNGWTNRETWAFMLHVQNNEGWSESARERLELTDGDNWLTDSLADWAEMWFTRAGYADEFGDDWPSALADAAAEIGSLWRINWAECVAALTEDQS